MLVSGYLPERNPIVVADDIGMICYTSGTTSRAKGVILSNYAIHAGMLAMGQEMDAKPHDVFLQTAPMFHSSVQVCNAFTFLGATAIIHRDFDPKATLDAIATDGATHTLLVPAMISALLEAPDVAHTDLSRLRRVLYGAAPMPPEMARRAMATLGCEFVNGYGLTEAVGLSMLRPEDHDVEFKPQLLESVGRDGIGQRVRILDDEWQELPADRIGHITARGPTVMEGYWNNADATARALRDGWLRTGDVGFRSRDGYLYLTDRADDMIITGGENVYPRQS
jgi:long-chain acyl-CoA synthetase